MNEHGSDPQYADRPSAAVTAPLRRSEDETVGQDVSPHSVASQGILAVGDRVRVVRPSLLADLVGMSGVIVARDGAFVLVDLAAWQRVERFHEREVATA